MKIYDLKEISCEEAGVMAFGFFDCMHLGHREVILKAAELARSIGAPTSVFLFKNNIFPILGIRKTPIFHFEERMLALERMGVVDRVYYVDADKAFLSESPRDFLLFLKEKLSISGFTCGADFSFGVRGSGAPQDLINAIGGAYSVLDLYTVDGEKISSEEIKNALSVGNLEKANRYLGREFSIVRKVLDGRKEGKRMGYPTINVALGAVPLKEGVYFTRVCFDGRKYAAVTNVGAHPTFGDRNANIETHLLDFCGDLYGKEVDIEFLKYRRPIVSFENVAELVREIGRDVEARREYD